MPFKLCNCDKEKLNKVIDQVKTLTDTVEELTAQIHLMKIRSIVTSDNSLTATCRKFQRRRDNVGAGTLHKLKRYLEKNIMHILPTDAGYLIKKKCQQIFSQSPRTFVPCPGRSTPRERKTRQHFPSTPPKERDGSQIHTSRPITRSYEPKIARSGIDKSEISSIRKRRKCVTKDAKTNTWGPSTVASSWEKPVSRDNSSSNCSTSYEIRDALHSSFIRENSGKPENRRTKKKTMGTTTTVLNSSGTIDEATKDPVKSMKYQRIVDLVDKNKNSVAVQANDSSASFPMLVDNTTVYDNRRFKCIDKGINEAFITKTLKSGSPDPCKNKSRSAQCSSNCSYLKRPKLYPRDVSTNTFPDEFIKATERVREQRPMTQKTQTSSKSDVQLDDSCFDERRRYCPTAKRKWFLEESLTSLTSCSPRSISSFCLESEVLGEGLIRRFHTSDEGQKFENKKSDESGEKTETIEKATSASRLQKTIAQEGDYEPRGNSREGYTKNRRKRTYVIPSDIEKPDETFRNNFQEDANNFSPANSECRFYERNEKNPRNRKVSKTPEATSPTFLESCPKEYKNKRFKKTVCTNRGTNDDLPKLSRWRRKTRSRIDTAVHPQICRMSSSSQEFLEPSCSLISDSDLSEKTHCSLKNHPRYVSVKKKKIKNEIQPCSSPEKSQKYTVYTSLSGSAMSIGSES